jgi:hypothetical protein
VKGGAFALDIDRKSCEIYKLRFGRVSRKAK